MFELRLHVSVSQDAAASFSFKSSMQSSACSEAQGANNAGSPCNRPLKTWTLIGIAVQYSFQNLMSVKPYSEHLWTCPLPSCRPAQSRHQSGPLRRSLGEGSEFDAWLLWLQAAADANLPMKPTLTGNGMVVMMMTWCKSNVWPQLQWWQHYQVRIRRSIARHSNNSNPQDWWFSGLMQSFPSSRQPGSPSSGPDNSKGLQMRVPAVTASGCLGVVVADQIGDFLQDRSLKQPSNFRVGATSHRRGRMQPRLAQQQWLLCKSAAAPKHGKRVKVHNRLRNGLLASFPYPGFAAVLRRCSPPTGCSGMLWRRFYW